MSTAVTFAEPDVELAAQIKSQVAAIDHLPMIKIEVVGKWIWVSGETKTVRQDLKSAGYFWSPKKKMWYWRPAGGRSPSKGMSMPWIRAKYGSTTVKVEDESL